MREAITFSDIEQRLGIVYNKEEPRSPLGDWYDAMRSVPIRSFADKDICISIRQQLYLDWLLPLALTRLEADPCTGELYDGELLVSLANVPPSYWSTHQPECRRLRQLLQGTIDIEFENVVRAIGDLRETVSRLCDSRPA